MYYCLLNLLNENGAESKREFKAVLQMPQPDGSKLPNEDLYMWPSGSWDDLAPQRQCQKQHAFAQNRQLLFAKSPVCTQGVHHAF